MVVVEERSTSRNINSRWLPLSYGLACVTAARRRMEMMGEDVGKEGGRWDRMTAVVKERRSEDTPPPYCRNECVVQRRDEECEEHQDDG